MPQVTVTIAGRVYRMACGEGEEPHLENLGRIVDAKVEDIRASFGEIGDQRLIVMAALTLADELNETKRKIALLEVDNLNLRDAGDSAVITNDAWAGKVAETLGTAAERIERLALTLNGKG